MNHSVGDGSTFWNFFNSWSEIFNSQQDDNNFCLKNPQIFRQVSGPLCRLPYSPLDESIGQSESPDLKERMFHFSSETLRSLKSKANLDCGATMISSLQSLTAFIWRSITRARSLSNDQETTCRFAVGTRIRMDPPLPANHFGVYTSLASTTAKTGDLLENVLGWAASKLHQAVTEQSSEKIASEIDHWLKSPFVLQPDQFSEPNLVHMGSSPRFDKYGSQFGMGKAVAVRSGYNSKHDGKVSAYPGREGGGSIDLEVCLLPEFMEALESDQEFMSLVTELVDGVFIGLSMNHSIGDGCTFWHFFNSFSDIFTNLNNLFCLKNPPIFRQVSGPLCRLPYSPLDKSSISHQSESPVLKERMFHFSSETVRSLKSKANQDCNTTTCFVSRILQSFAKCLVLFAGFLTVHLISPPLVIKSQSRLFAADSRSRMDPPLPMNHVGFYVSATSTTAKNGDLLEKNGLGWAASKLHQAVTEHTGEKIASQIDRWLKSPPAAVHDPNVVHMGSSPRFDKYGCQFGMGKAVMAVSLTGRYQLTLGEKEVEA
ncbi:hypothetical protein F2Q68_00000226 [Brassica cretica]|uniref:Acetyltransferase n=1 Tax=Brassica cretica TaxID=69181 RepID=A0A8S9JKU1_BRACR|nr:hypothetical protein F2Q68_00000226 [Brassica cretica]